MAAPPKAYADLLTDFQELRDHDEWLADRLEEVKRERDEAREAAHEYMLAAADDGFAASADERWDYIQQQRARFPWLKR